MQTHCYNTYSFEELSEDSKETAIKNMHEINVDYQDWAEFILDDAKEIGKLIGIEIDNIYYSGFWSQGDGACFEGSYEYKRGGAKALKEYAPQDTELHRIAERLQAIQRPHFYRLTASVKQQGHYMHEGCTAIDVYDENSESSYYADYDSEAEIAELLRDFMRWIYRQLESDYEYQTEKEQIKDTILANDYQFREDGRLG